MRCITHVQNLFVVYSLLIIDLNIKNNDMLFQHLILGKHPEDFPLVLAQSVMKIEGDELYCRWEQRHCSS